MKISNVSWNGEYKLEKKIRVNTSSSAYIGYDDGTLRRLNTLGQRLWTADEFSMPITAIVETEGKMVYVSSEDGNIKKLDDLGALLWSFTQHTDSVNELGLYRGNDPETIYSASSDNTVRKIEANGTQTWSFTGHTNEVTGVTVDIDNYAYSCSLDGTVKKIALDGQSALWSKSEHSDTINGVYADIDGFVYSYGDDNQIVKYDGETGDVVWKSTANSSAVLDLTMDQYGNIYSVSLDGMLRNLNSEGSEVSSIDLGSVPTGVDISVSGYIYVGITGGIKRYDNSLTEEWYYSNHSSNSSTIYTSHQTVMFPPVITYFEFVPLLAPENLSAE